LELGLTESRFERTEANVKAEMLMHLSKLITKSYKGKGKARYLV